MQPEEKTRLGVGINERERKITVLRYNLIYPVRVDPTEQIEAMNFGHGDDLGHSAGHISNKTLYITLTMRSRLSA